MLKKQRKYWRSLKKSGPLLKNSRKNLKITKNDIIYEDHLSIDASLITPAPVPSRPWTYQLAPPLVASSCPTPGASEAWLSKRTPPFKTVAFRFCFRAWTLHLLTRSRTMEVVVESPNIKYSEGTIEATYDYLTTRVEKQGRKLVVSFPLAQSSRERDGPSSWIFGKYI